MATFSLIIPMYNSEKYIASALGSLLPSAQILSEVILVDDRSTDHGVEIAHTFDTLLPMRYFVTSEDMDRGPGNARQLGLDNATSEWVGFMDADDLLAPDAMRHVANAVANCEGAQMFIGNFVEREPTSARLGVTHKEDPTWVHGKWYRRSMIEEYTIRFKPNLYTHEDIYFNALIFDRLRHDNKDFYVIDELLYYWNQNANSMTSNDKYTLINLHDYLESVIDSHLTMWDVDDEMNQKIKKVAMCQYVQGYFYYQSFIYHYSVEDADCKRAWEALVEYYVKLTNQFNMTRDEFISFLYSNAESYSNQRIGTMKTFGYFIETDSLPAFICRIADSI